VIKKQYVLAIDLGGTFLRLAWFNNGLLEDQEIFEAPKSATDFVKLIMAKHRNPIAIGAAVPGFWDEQKILRQSINLPQLVGQPVWGVLEKQLNIPVFIRSDVELAAWGQAVHGYQNKYSNLLFINLGTGLGAGLFKDGKPLTTKYSPTLRLDYIIHPQRAMPIGRKEFVEVEYDSIDLFTTTLINLSFILSPQIIVFGGGKTASHWNTLIEPALNNAKPYLEQNLSYKIEFAKANLEYPGLYGAYELVLNCYNP